MKKRHYIQICLTDMLNSIDKELRQKKIHVMEKCEMNTDMICRYAEFFHYLNHEFVLPMDIDDLGMLYEELYRLWLETVLWRCCNPAASDKIRSIFALFNALVRKFLNKEAFDTQIVQSFWKEYSELRLQGSLNRYRRADHCDTVLAALKDAFCFIVRIYGKYV
mgnify:FL=1